jgi:hypothetical protein
MAREAKKWSSGYDVLAVVFHNVKYPTLEGKWETR